MTGAAVQNADDPELVAAVRAGDDRAFELLFERYQARITAYVRGMVHDHGRAEDITQDVFIAALRRMRATAGDIAFKPWIFEIAKNACIDAFRRGRNTHEVSFDADEALGPADQLRLVATEPAPDAVMDNKLALDDLCGAFGGLSQTHHDILVKRELEGMSYREIGEQLRMSQGAVESTLFRARRRLGKEYAEISSGERCTLVRHMADASGTRTLGVREQRRMRRHVSRCRPCMRYALSVGLDLGAPGMPGSRAAKVAALLPLPAFLRRRGVDPVGQLVGSHPHAASVAGALDPVSVSGWGKAVCAATAVAVAGVGAGGAASQRDSPADLVPRGPAIIAQSQDRAAVDGVRTAGRSATRRPRGSEELVVQRSARPGRRRAQTAVSPSPGSTDSGSAPTEPPSPQGKAFEPAPANQTREPATINDKPALRPLRRIVEGAIPERVDAIPKAIGDQAGGVGAQVRRLAGGVVTGGGGGESSADPGASRKVPKPTKIVRGAVGTATAGPQ